mmetsp:Transcript_41005/g.128571  ORF Transcript_41005/g.128571 Transcript_41005/m.128571 type:complete len:234 (-) Transcript_41005:14-715(-)
MLPFIWSQLLSPRGCTAAPFFLRRGALEARAGNARFRSEVRATAGPVVGHLEEDHVGAVGPRGDLEREVLVAHDLGGVVAHELDGVAIGVRVGHGYGAIDAEHVALAAGTHGYLQGDALLELGGVHVGVLRDLHGRVRGRVLVVREQVRPGVLAVLGNVVAAHAAVVGRQAAGPGRDPRLDEPQGLLLVQVMLRVADAAAGGHEMGPGRGQGLPWGPGGPGGGGRAPRGACRP